MKIRIEFDTDNAAFQEYPHGEGNFDEEVRYVINQAYEFIIGSMSGDGKLKDTNGNTVGTVWCSTTCRHKKMMNPYRRE